MQETLSQSELARIAGTCLASRARMAARALSRRYDRALRPHGLKITQFAVLVAAARSEGRMTMTEIAEALGLERSTLSRNFAPLEARGLVALGPETRHRARHVGLTEAGRALLAAAAGDWARAQAETEAALGPEAGAAAGALARLAAAGEG